MQAAHAAAPGAAGIRSKPPALLVFVLDWFHGHHFAGHLSVRHWRRLPPRIPDAVQRALQLCGQVGAKATFFVPGSVAMEFPGLVRQLHEAGHEIGLLGAEPGDLGAVPPEQQESAWQQVLQARKALEGMIGARVQCFAAPWPVRVPVWWKERLASAGLAHDASVVQGCLPESDARHVVLATWQLDTAQPRLVGLPKAVLAAHYRQLLAGLPPEACNAVTLREALRLPVPEPLPLASTPLVSPETDPGIRPGPLPRPGLPRLALVIPLKDERDGLPSLLRELMAIRARFAELVDWHWILVDDGSSDGGSEWLQQELAGCAGVTLLRHAENRGIAAALRTGFAASDAEWLASIDADLSYDPLELLAMLPLLAEADVVTASPYHRLGGVKNVPPWRLLLSRGLSQLYRWLLRRDIATWTSCCRVYRAASVRGLPVTHPGFLGTAELLVRVLLRGGVVREHPCVLEARLFGLSKMKVLRTIRGHLHLLWQVLRGKIR